MTYTLKCLDCKNTSFDNLEGYEEEELLPPCPICGGELEIIDKGYGCDKIQKIASFRTTAMYKIHVLSEYIYQIPSCSLNRQVQRDIPTLQQQMSGFIELD